MLRVSGLGHLFGTDGGDLYDFYSGFAQAIGSITLLGGLIALGRKHNCHVKGCWRIGRQQIEGKNWLLCHKHHPDGRPTSQDVLDHAARTRAARSEKDSLPVVR
jgi:hypothetical protein